MLRQLARRLSTTPTVVTSRAAGPIAVLSVDDGKANAFTQPMVEQLNSALDDCTDAGAVVIVGNAKALSAGFDLNVMSDALSGRAAPSDEACTLYASSFELMLRCAAFPRPLVLANRGHALALGGIWLHCADYRIGPSDRPDAKIGIPAVRLGYLQPSFAVELGRARLAPPYLVRSTTLGEIYNPAEAVTAGFLDRLVPADEVEAAALKVREHERVCRRHAEHSERLQDGWVRACMEQLKLLVKPFHVVRARDLCALHDHLPAAGVINRLAA